MEGPLAASMKIRIPRRLCESARCCVVLTEWIIADAPSLRRIACDEALRTITS